VIAGELEGIGGIENLRLPKTTSPVKPLHTPAKFPVGGTRARRMSQNVAVLRVLAAKRRRYRATCARCRRRPAGSLRAFAGDFCHFCECHKKDRRGSFDLFDHPIKRAILARGTPSPFFAGGFRVRRLRSLRSMPQRFESPLRPGAWPASWSTARKRQFSIDHARTGLRLRSHRRNPSDSRPSTPEARPDDQRARA